MNWWDFFLKFLRNLLNTPTPVPPVPTPTPTPQPTPIPMPTPEPTPSPVPADDWHAEVVRLINQERSARMLNQFHEHAALDNFAQAHTDFMADHKVLDHNEGNIDFRSRVAHSGISFGSAAENIALSFPTPAAVVKGWMNSPGHRANILGNYAEIGIGRSVTGNMIYWTTDFGNLVHPAMFNPETISISLSGSLVNEDK